MLLQPPHHLHSSFLLIRKFFLHPQQPSRLLANRHQKISADFNYHNILSSWAKSGDKVNKLFFAVHNHHKTTVRISRLKCQDGSYTTDSSQMREIASHYYETLLKARSFSEDDLIKRDIIWSKIQNRVSRQLLDCLLQPLNSQEVFKDAEALAIYTKLDIQTDAFEIHNNN